MINNPFNQFRIETVNVDQVNREFDLVKRAFGVVANLLGDGTVSKGAKGDTGANCTNGTNGVDVGGFVINYSFGMNPNSTADIFPVGSESDPQFFFNQTSWGDIYTAYAFAYGGGNIIVTNSAGQQIIEFPVDGGPWSKCDLRATFWEALPNDATCAGVLYVTKNSGVITPVLTGVSINMPGGAFGANISPGAGPASVSSTGLSLSVSAGDKIGLYFLGNTPYRSSLPTQSRYRFTATIRLYN